MERATRLHAGVELLDEGIQVKDFTDASRHVTQSRPHFTDTTWRAFELVWVEGVPATDAAARLAEPLDRIYVAKSRVLKRLQAAVRELADDAVLPDH